MEAIANFLTSTGFYQFFQGENWKSAIMLVIACVLLFLGIVKKFEPLLLVPIAIGMLVTNLPGAGMFHEILFAGGHVHWELFGGQPITASFLSEMLNSGVSADVLQPYADSLWTAAQSMFGADALSQVAAQVAAATGDAVNSIAVQIQTLASAEQFAAASGLTMSNVTVSVGLVDVLYLGIKLGIYPCLIFMGVGAMTDFGPLLSNPKSLLLGAAAQLGVFVAFLGGVLLGLGLAWTTTTMVGSIVHRWCPAHAGKIMGLILAANGVGAAVATQIVTPIIYAPGDAFGYRNAYKLVALILAVTAGIVLALYREPPEKIPESTSAEKEPQQAESGQSTARGARFYLLLVCVFLTGFILQSTTGVSAAHMKDVGLDAGYVAAVVSAHALSLTVCKFLTGVIHDHAGLRRTVLLCDCAAITVLILLAEVTATPTGRVLAMAYGILSALALPLETIMLPLIAQDLFQGPQYNKMLGIIVSVNTAGYAVGTPIANLTFDCLGTYQPMLLASACVMAGVTICIQQLLKRCAAEKSA